MTLRQDTDPTVSVAMCTYNGERYLAEQLDSLTTQTKLPAELLICDDCSSDTTIVIAEEFKRKAPFPVRIIRNEVNLGFRKNFEQAIRLCEGEYIALCDQDDRWYPHKIAKLVEVMSGDEAVGGVFSDGDLISQTGKLTGQTLWQRFDFPKREQSNFTRSESLRVLMRRNVVTGMTLMFRASLRDCLLPIPCPWIHDGWMAWMIALHSRLVALPERLVAYRIHDLQQIGAPPGLIQRVSRAWHGGIRTYLAQARVKGLNDYETSALECEALAAYFAKRELQSSLAVDALAKAKAMHSRRLIEALGKSRRQRFAHLLQESPNYWKFSSRRLRAMFRDMVI